jgi:hypothetical protein
MNAKETEAFRDASRYKVIHRELDAARAIDDEIAAYLEPPVGAPFPILSRMCYSYSEWRKEDKY